MCFKSALLTPSGKRKFSKAPRSIWRSSTAQDKLLECPPPLCGGRPGNALEDYYWALGTPKAVPLWSKVFAFYITGRLFRNRVNSTSYRSLLMVESRKALTLSLEPKLEERSWWVLGLLNAVPKKVQWILQLLRRIWGWESRPLPRKQHCISTTAARVSLPTLSQSIANPKEQSLEKRVYVRGSLNDKAQMLLLFLAKKTSYRKEGGCKEMWPGLTLQNHGLKNYVGNGGHLTRTRYPPISHPFLPLLEQSEV